MPKSLLAAKAKAYEIRFGLPLIDRVQSLIAEYPDVTSPNFLSWEGEGLTGADTSAKLRDLLVALTPPCQDCGSRTHNQSECVSY